MTKIYFISAAESEGRIYRVVQGWSEGDITPRGREQVRALTERLRNVPLDNVYSSDLFIARLTAEAICAGRQLSCQTDSGLRELCFGVWEGMSLGNISCEMPEQLEYFRTALHRWKVQDAESPGQVQRRMLATLGKIAGENEGGTVAVISHPAAIGLTLAALQGIPLEEAHSVLAREPAAVSVLTWDGESRHILSQDDRSHPGTEAGLTGEKVHARPDFDPNLCFFHLRYVEYGEMMADSMESIWAELSDPRPFNRDILLDDAGRLQTVVGHVEQAPAAFLQYGVTPGWISLLCVAPACRNAGLGTQLLGQAVLHTRSMGGDALYIPLAKGNPHRTFFLHRGFSVVDELDDGRELLEKDIRFTLNIASM